MRLTLQCRLQEFLQRVLTGQENDVAASDEQSSRVEACTSYVAVCIGQNQ